MGAFSKARPEIGEQDILTMNGPKQVARKNTNLAKIWNWFLKPLVRWYPKGSGLQSIMNGIFHASERDIILVKAAKEFKMPGLFLLTAEYPIRGLGPRRIRPGMSLFVRSDSTEPNRIDVEVIKGKHSGVFMLTPTEWRQIKPFLKLP